MQSEVNSEKQISYIKAYMWNLEKWYRYTEAQTQIANTQTLRKGRRRG